MRGTRDCIDGRRLALFALAAAILVAGWASLAPGTSSGGSTKWHEYRADHIRAQLSRLNMLRTGFGARELRLVDAWSDGCARHAYYMVRNDLITHDEEPGKPGYSVQGDRAGATSVLSFPPSNPFPSSRPDGVWSEAPFHQLQLLNPRLERTGIAQGCVNTIRGVDYGAQGKPGLKLMLWPGIDSAPVRRTVNACSEGPRDPFTVVGWDCNGLGPALYVYALDPTKRACGDFGGEPKVDVTGPGGSVPARVAAPYEESDGFVFCEWVIVIGEKLARGEQYTATVKLGGKKLTRDFRARG